MSKVGNCPGGSYPAGNCQVGSCPDTSLVICTESIHDFISMKLFLIHMV